MLLLSGGCSIPPDSNETQPAAQAPSVTQTQQAVAVDPTSCHIRCLRNYLRCHRRGLEDSDLCETFFSICVEFCEDPLPTPPTP